MDKNSIDSFLILVKTNVSIDQVVKPFVKTIDKQTLHKIKWLYISEHKINDESYLTIALNEFTFNFIKKLKKCDWILVHKYILKDKFHNENYKVVSCEMGFYKYKLINTVYHCHRIDEQTSIDSNLWKVLSEKKQQILLEFLIALRKKRKIDFLILNDIFSSTTEKEIANQVCEQANSYKKHYQLLRIGQDIIACLGRLKNIIDFYIEDGSINFALKDNEIINQKVLNELEIVKKTKTSAKNLTSLFINHDMEALYQIMKKIIRDNPCSLYVSSG
ncbi:hypothetical protein [Spiroplasma endosymbiont of Nephrotoma flavescens]|uniref:hypothetical protein n=1 Tax=Spiroplasma endosymbiont of Nephrotoma flavescens TaxID=3066302 RepID=UPI00313CCD7B